MEWLLSIHFDLMSKQMAIARNQAFLCVFRETKNAVANSSQVACD